jgi:hypothetical protein
MRSRAEREARLARVARLIAAEPEISDREAARRLGTTDKTVAADRRRLVDRADGPRPPAPPLGNQRAATAGGATGEFAVAPLRHKHAEELLQDFPWIDGRRRAILADRLARIEAAIAWLDRQGGVVRNREGEVYPVVDRVDRWGSRVEKLLRELDEEGRALGRSRLPDQLGAGDLAALSSDDRRQLLALVEKASAATEGDASDE